MHLSELNNPYGYEEAPQALGKRIQAHSRYSNFNLHQWIQKNFPLKKGDAILDLGCGNGNYASLFWEQVKPDGFILGLDKNEELIAQAREQHASDRIRFQVQDFDQGLTLEGTFQWIFAIYSIYYAADGKRLVEAALEYLAPGGRFVVIGPGPKNVQGLLELTERLTGKPTSSKVNQHLTRISEEFKPWFDALFAPENVTQHTIDTVMEFPNAEAFGDYYWSTIFWREGTASLATKEVGRLKSLSLKWSGSALPIRVQKQIICLAGKK